MDPVPSHVCPLCPQQSSLSTKVAQRMSFGLLGRGAGAAARCEFVRMKGPGGKGHAEVRGDGRVSLCLLEEITQNLAVDSATPKTGINIQLFCCTTSRWLCLVRARPACTRRALNRDSPPRSCGTATGRMTRMTCSCIDIRYTIPLPSAILVCYLVGKSQLEDFDIRWELNSLLCLSTITLLKLCK